MEGSLARVYPSPALPYIAVVRQTFTHLYQLFCQAHLGMPQNCHSCVGNQDTPISIPDICWHQQGLVVLAVRYSYLFMWGTSSQWSSK